MQEPLRILSIEVDLKGMQPIQDLLETEGIVCEVTRIDSEAALPASVEQGGIDLIVADYRLPSFAGISALKFAMKACPDVPFIFVSGTPGEGVAIEALKIGATDSILKTNLSRLVSSVLRALREVIQRAERKRAEESLRQSEAYLAEAQRLSHTGSFGWRVATGEIIWSAETFRIFEYERTTTPSLELILQRIHPEDAIFVKETIERAAQTGKDLDFGHRLLMPDGAVKHVYVVGHAKRYQSKDFEYVGAVMDITAAKRSQEALQRSEAYLAEAQRLTRTGSWAYNVASKELIHSSEEHSRLFGFDRERGVPLFEELIQRIHPEERVHAMETFENQIRSATDSDGYFRIVHPDGTTKWVYSTAHPVFNASGDLVEFVGILMDITERKRAEEERERLHQAQADLAHVARVTTMGELTASLAHEIKQPISAAITDARTCLRWLDREDPDLAEAREAASRIIKDVTRASDIINRIGILFKKGTPQHELLDVNEVIQEMIALLHGEASRYSISIQGELASDLPKVMADRVQLQQVLMNLMLNAIDAMKESIRGKELSIKSEVSDDHILISVRDSGIGIPSQEADKIFDAFFTTKPHGTGMGLPISRSIIESHGGRLWVSGASGKGATFQFTLPTTLAAHA
jgi:PAS domain S-box-containing protein